MILLYDLCYRVFFWLKRMKRRFPAWEKEARWFEYYFTLLLNRKMVCWFETHPVKWGLNTQKREERYIVSLTSFPARIEYVHIAIETLMRQTCKPDKIVLWLAESQFPDKVLPKRLTALQDKGLTIRFCEDLRSHKKYYYAFQEYPQDNILFADDDIFYPRDTVKRLIWLHKKHPKDVVAVSGQIIGPTMDAMPSVWPAPELGKRYVSSWEAQAFTGAGSLFPAKWYTDEVFNREKSMGLAATADDLWLKAMSLVAGAKTTLDHPTRGFPVEVEIKDNVTLFQQNKVSGENLNDKVWKALVEEYGLNRLQQN